MLLCLAYSYTCHCAVVNPHAGSALDSDGFGFLGVSSEQGSFAQAPARPEPSVKGKVLALLSLLSFLCAPASLLAGRLSLLVFLSSLVASRARNT